MMQPSSSKRLQQGQVCAQGLLCPGPGAPQLEIHAPAQTAPNSSPGFRAVLSSFLQGKLLPSLPCCSSPPRMGWEPRNQMATG